MNSKKITNNVFSGLLGQLTTILLGLLIPKLFLENFGSEVNGMVASINQLFVYVGLLEAGIGIATVQALYTPVSINDTNRINKILSATNKYYKKVAIYFLVIVIVISIVYPQIINSNVNSATVSLIILLTGTSGILNFLFYGKFKLLLMAEGKTYVVTRITTFIAILTGLTKILILLNSSELILIFIGVFFVNILQWMLISVYISKYYKWIDLNVNPDFNAISRKGSAFIHQVASLVFNNTDILILTLFCDLKIVSVYVLYNLVFTMSEALINSIGNSFVFVLGHRYNNNILEFNKQFNVFELYYISISFGLMTTVFIVCIPFMKLYTSGITDINYIDFWIPILFVIMKMLSISRMPGVHVISIAGYFKETQNRALIEMFLNIVFSLIFVNYLGLYGVLLGSIVALLYRTNDIIIYSNKIILNRTSIKTYKLIFLNLILSIILSIILLPYSNSIDSYLNLVLFAIVSGLFNIFFYCFLSYLIDKKSGKVVYSYLKIIINNRKN